MLVQISSPFGLISLGPIGGVAFSRGDGVRDPIVTFHASLAATNIALAGLTYVTSQDYYGSDNITITVSDNGFTGRGGALYDVRVIPLTVYPVNDPVTWCVMCARTHLRTCTRMHGRARVCVYAQRVVEIRTS